MSLATSIKDFSDTLNNLYTVKSSSLPILPFLQELLIFSVKSVLSGVLYIFTFEWFRDVSYLPLLNPTSPQQLEIANAESLLFPGLSSLPFGDSFFTDPVSHFLSFSDIPKNSTDYILSGLLNSFFFSLPFSLPHLISIRRLFSQGVQAAVASLVGSIAAHSVFLISIFYGLRFLIVPWFSLEPITYILGFSVNVLIIKELIQASPQRFQKTVYAGTSTNMGVNTNKLEGLKNSFGGSTLSSIFVKRRSFLFSTPLLRITVLSFVLTWCEQLNVFSSITNLTLNAQNTYLDLYPSTNVSNSLLVHTIYVLAFIVGNCIFSFFFYYLFLKMGGTIASWTNLSSTKINDAINKLVMLLILTFTFASFPYYGLDYLFGKIGGFLPEDPVYKETVLSPTKITVNKRNTLFIKAESADKKKHTSLLDINNFDNGVYLNNIDFNKFDNFPSDSKNSITRTTSFEKSNYRQENAWIRRNYLARLRAKPRKNADNSSTTSFYKAFKDPKAYYQKIQLESDKKRSQNVRDTRAKTVCGSFADRQEGILAEEPISKIQYLWDQVLGFPVTVPKLRFGCKNEAFATTSFWYDDLLQIIKKQMYLGKGKPFTEIDRQMDSASKGTFGVAKASLLRDKSSTDHSDTLPFNPNNLDLILPTKSVASSLPNIQNSKKDNELDLETNIFAEKYTKGVRQKNSAPLLKKTKSLSTKNIIKRKFFLNPVYRTLLQTDIDAFMARQPALHNLTENQDYDLYKKRVILEKYYNWLRYYSPLQKYLQDLYNISETRSFVDSVFHHQFKGTLKIAKRLFPVTFDPQQNSKKSRVLSYDQNLYKDLQRSDNPLLHEELTLTKPRPEKAELDQKSEQSSRKQDPLLAGKLSSSYKKKRDNNRTQKQTDAPSTLTDLQKGRATLTSNKTLLCLKPEPAQSEELDSKLQLQELCGNKASSSLASNLTNSPFIEESDTSPFYAGWDDTTRRFVITNKFFVEKQ